MLNSNNRLNEISLFRCPYCRQISHKYEWLLLEDKGKYQCPKCLLLCNRTLLKLINIELLKRGRIWIK